MKTIKSVILASFVLLFATTAGFAQIGFKSDSTSKSGFDNFGNNASLLKHKRLGFSMEMGVGVTGSKYGVGSYTYVAPFLSYRVSPKFRLDVGASYIQGFNNSGINEYLFGKNPSYLSLFARGNYLVSDKLIISGAVYKTFDLNKPQTSDLNTQKKTFDNYGIMVGAEYKITEHLTIGAQLNISDRNTNGCSPFYQDNYFGGSQQGCNSYSPFGYNRQQPGFSRW
ncbi:MAG TPA: outer membrane beta-barrel protein [Bacteroidales bacterium]|nr:outer membrane beta-barrel protein [Bacteroidales bacterium]